MSRTPARPPTTHPSIHPSNHSSILPCSPYLRVALVLLNRERSQAPAKFGRRQRTSLCAWRQKRWSERRKRKIAVDGPDGDSIAFSLHCECDACACMCVCVSSAIHHPICQQRQSSALSHTKNWLRDPLIGLNVTAILPYTSVREGASQAWSIGLASELKPMWIPSHYVNAIGPLGGNLLGAYREN